MKWDEMRESDNVEDEKGVLHAPFL